MEQEFCTAVFWRGGEKIDLHGLEPEAVRYLSVTGERKVGCILFTGVSQSGRIASNGKM